MYPVLPPISGPSSAPAPYLAGHKSPVPVSDRRARRIADLEYALAVEEAAHKITRHEQGNRAQNIIAQMEKELDTLRNEKAALQEANAALKSGMGELRDIIMNAYPGRGVMSLTKRAKLWRTDYFRLQVAVATERAKGRTIPLKSFPDKA
jgi:predicted secreted Zn-dependent protease